MIETVQERQRGAYNFESYYENLCALQDTCPVPAVKAHLNEAVLDINGDRIRQQDWQPIFNSIKINKSLKFIAVRSYFQLNLDDAVPEKKAKVMRSRIPVIRMKEMTAALCKSIRDCLASTENLECLELQGIHLRESHISLIGQGIMKNTTLKHLSLECCRVADAGLSVLCSAMKMAGNISTLNLTSCNLSSVGIRDLADLIKFQAMSRHNQAWKESLRYRWANFDTMIGLRRMTLNRNLSIGDEGAILLAESLKDDLWVKAIDLQECGLSSDAVRAFLKVLKLNSTLIVLDMRRNALIDRELLKSVTEQVLINGYGKEIEYQWLRVEDSNNHYDENFDRHPRSYYHGPTRPLESESRPAFKPAGRLRSRSASSIDRRSLDRNGDESLPKTPRSSSRGVGTKSGSKGQPWRTAVRATRYKGYPPDHVPGKSNLEEHYELSGMVKENKPERVFTHPPIRPTSKSKDKVRTDDNSARTITDDEKSSSVVSPLVNGMAHHPPLPESVKELKTEVFHLRKELDKYQEERGDIDQKLKEIYNENSRLRNTIKLMSKTHSVVAQRSEKSAIMQDEAILETIDNSFQQFNAFLDMLRQSGFSRIVTAAGMDNFTTSKNIMDRINRPRYAASNESIGTSVSSVKHLEMVSNGSSQSHGEHKRQIGMENGSDKGDIRITESGGKHGQPMSLTMANEGLSCADGDSRRLPEKVSLSKEDLADNSVLASAGWKDDMAAKISGDSLGRLCEGDEMKAEVEGPSNRSPSGYGAVDLLDWKSTGKGKVVNKVAVFGDVKDDNPLDSIDWRKSGPSPYSEASNRGTGDCLDVSVDRMVHDNSREINHNRTASAESIDEPAEISEKIQTSHAGHHLDPEKQSSRSKTLDKSADLYVESFESGTENSDNGLTNEPAMDYRYYQQASLDAAQELSTDTSYND